MTTWVVSVLALGLAGCAYLSKSPSAERLPDGTVRLKCPSSLAECLEQADEVCRGTRFKVLGGIDKRDYMGPQGSAGEQEARSSEAIIRCGKRGKSLFGDEDSRVPNAAACAEVPAKPAAPAASSSPAPSCTPGTTQQCVGPGACRGGQACLPGGTGYTVCDCGPAAASPVGTGDAGVSPSVAPPTTPVASPPR